MKKICFLLCIVCMLFSFVSCSSEKSDKDDVLKEIGRDTELEENDLTDISGEQVIGKTEENLKQQKTENIVNIPDMGYEATLKEEEGNVLFAYYVPLGWSNDDSPAYGDYVSTKLVREVEGIWGQQVDLECRKNKGYIELYDTGVVNSKYLDTSDRQSYMYEGDANTPYGTFKFYHLHEPDEYVNDRELAIFK